MYGGFGGSSECKYEFMRCTKVVFPEPAMPIVMITDGFLVEVCVEDEDEEDAMVVGE